MSFSSFLQLPKRVQGWLKLILYLNIALIVPFCCSTGEPVVYPRHCVQPGTATPPASLMPKTSSSVPPLSHFHLLVFRGEVYRPLHRQRGYPPHASTDAPFLFSLSPRRATVRVEHFLCGNTSDWRSTSTITGEELQYPISPLHPTCVAL